MFELNGDYYLFEESDPTVAEMFGKQGPGNGRTVLDVGCGRAALGRSIEDMGFRVTGIEFNDTAIETARGRIGEVIGADILDHSHVDEILAGRKFDFLVMADVLEHLSDPLATLKFYRRFLAENGVVVISVPNVAVWDNRLRMLFGAFNYAETGLMDRTHLRFFTFATAGTLVKEGGYGIVDTDFSPGIVRAFLPLLKCLLFGGGGKDKKDKNDPAAIMDSAAYKAYKSYLLPVERLVCSTAKGLFAFRIVIAATRTDKHP